MASAETTSAAAGLLKQVYNTDIVKVIPASSIMQEEVEFVKDGQREGAQFNCPVLLSYPTGFTYGAGFATYQTIVASNLQFATVTGSNINLRDGIANDLISRALSDKNSFMTAAKYVMMALQKSMSKELELNLLYGSNGIGNTGTTAFASVDSTHETVTITAATWAPAIWSGMEGMPISFYNGSSVVSSEGAYSVSAVSIVNRTVTVVGASGAITTLHALSGTALDVYTNTAYGNQMLGLYGILTATGNLFGLSTTSYSVWQPNTFDCGSAPLTLGKIEDANALAVARGADEDMTLLVNPNSYANLITEASSARRFDSSYETKDLENGAKALTYFGPSGSIKIVAHPFVKQGHAFMVPFDRAKRIGSTDITFDLPGFAGPALYLPSPTNTGVEVRVFTSQALFIEAPSHTVYLSNVVASSN